MDSHLGCRFNEAANDAATPTQGGRDAHDEAGPPAEAGKTPTPTGPQHHRAFGEKLRGRAAQPVGTSHRRRCWPLRPIPQAVERRLAAILTDRQFRLQAPRPPPPPPYLFPPIVAPPARS